MACGGLSGKAASLMMYLCRLSRRKSEQVWPPCPSKTWLSERYPEERADRPAATFFVLRLDHVQDDGHAVFVVRPHQPLAGVHGVRLDHVEARRRDARGFEARDVAGNRLEGRPDRTAGRGSEVALQRLLGPLVHRLRPELRRDLQTGAQQAVHRLVGGQVDGPVVRFSLHGGLVCLRRPGPADGVRCAGQIIIEARVESVLREVRRPAALLLARTSTLAGWAFRAHSRPQLGAEVFGWRAHVLFAPRSHHVGGFVGAVQARRPPFGRLVDSGTRALFSLLGGLHGSCKLQASRLVRRFLRGNHQGVDLHLQLAVQVHFGRQNLRQRPLLVLFVLRSEPPLVVVAHCN